MKRLGYSTLLAMSALGMVSAHAADLPRYVAPPPPVIEPSWTGPYVGLLAGFSWGDMTNDTSGKDLYCALCSDSIANNHYMSGARSSQGSLAGGAQIGYNVQVGNNVVFGVVGDIMAFERKGSVDKHVVTSGGGGNQNGIQFGDTFINFGNENSSTSEDARFQSSIRHNWLATARGKLGYAFGPTAMLYATGGLAMGGLESRSSSLTVEMPSNVSASGSGGGDHVAFGFAVGGGGEYRFTDHWSVSAEYLYYQLSHSYSVAVTNGSPPSYDVKAKVNGNLVRVGLNYALW